MYFPPRYYKFILPAIVALLFIFAPTALASTSLQITSPTPNQKVESDQVLVAWKLTGFSLVDYAKNTKNRPGEGHLHLWLDEKNPTPGNAIKVVSGNSYTLPSVKTGQHTLFLELVNSDHSPVKPPVKQAINFQSAKPITINPNLPQNDITLFYILVAIILVGALWYFLAPEPIIPAKTTSAKTAKTSKKKK